MSTETFPSRDIPELSAILEAVVAYYERAVEAALTAVEASLP
jgi:hypothetical protein